MKKMMKLLISACCFFFLTGGVFLATTYQPQTYGWDSIPASYDEMHEKLASETKNSGVNVLRFDSLLYSFYELGEEQAFNEIKFMMPCTEIIQWFVTYEHAFGNHVEELKAMGYTNVDYSPVLSPGPQEPVTTPPAETPVTAPTPLEYSVEPLESAKTMWATQQVNYRDGADTTYNKVGQLKKHDQITVVGIASTNWYQFSLDGGATYVYASNKYFTDVDPSNRSVLIDNPETGSYTAYEFSETDPSVIDKAIEQLEEEAEQKASEIAAVEETEVQTVEETTTEPVTVTEAVEEETEVQTADLTITENVSQLSWSYIIIVAILIGIIIVSIVMIIKYSKK